MATIGRHLLRDNWGQQHGVDLGRKVPVPMSFFIRSATEKADLNNRYSGNAFYGTMATEKSQQNRGNSPLLVEGKAPLDVLVERLGITQKEFCLILDIGDTSTFRSWRAGKPPRWSTWQAKKLDELMRQAGLSGIQDLPDDLSRYGTKAKST